MMRHTAMRLLAAILAGVFLTLAIHAAAKVPAERNALDARYNDARQKAKANGSEPALDRFEVAVRSSKAVICRRWGTIWKIAKRGNQMFKTYYRQLDDGERLPEDNEFDQARQGIDASFFPYYFESINFAALSLNDCGPNSYGECVFIFRDEAIAHRTSVFEENLLVYYRKNLIPAGQPPPPGLRAVWNDRHRLAVAKLHGEIHPNTSDASFAALFLKPKGATDADEFIEAHVYGMLDVKAVERFVAPKPLTKADRTLATSPSTKR